MKAKFTNGLLGLAALVLLGANIVVWRSDDPMARIPGGNETGGGSIGTEPDAVVQRAEAKGRTEAEERTEPGARRAFDFHWSAVETTDYKEYAANLRKLGFPEELVQGIVIADVNKQYEARESALREAAIPFDAPVSERQRKITREDLERMQQLRAVQMEKQAVLKEILGIYVPREVMKTPTARNYIGYEYALSLLPEEKRDGAQTALENEWFEDDINKHLDRVTYVEVYKQTRAERNAALKAVLTAEEFELFEMNSNPAGTELARRTIGMEPTEEEFREMFRVAWDHWVETGGVGGLWRAQKVPREQIAAADAKLEERMSGVLGPERYLDYRMATSETGQRMRNLAARYGLTRETIGPAFEWQMEADQLAKAIGNAAVEAAPRVAELEQRIERTLGPAIWDAWRNGRHQRVDLDP